MELTQSIEIMKSLADTSRLQILNSLMEKAQYVEEIANRLNLAASTVSFHLKKLETAGLISKQKDQYYFVFKLNEDVFNLTLRELTSFKNIEKYIQEERINKYRSKVLKTFFNKEKLLKLPVQKKKKMIILEEFFRKFEFDKVYPESEVDKIILKHYEDYCTIRRLLVEEGMMSRNKGNYQLNKNYALRD